MRKVRTFVETRKEENAGLRNPNVSPGCLSACVIRSSLRTPLRNSFRFGIFLLASSPASDPLLFWFLNLIFEIAQIRKQFTDLGGEQVILRVDPCP